MLFDYPSNPHSRIHGPAGYTTYQSYKPWLRDEFAFRCVYCLFRERWYPNGDDSFGVDHIFPKAVEEYHSLECEYTNLLYCCNRCNSVKQKRVVADPCKEGFAKHVVVQSNGRVAPLTAEGALLVRYLMLNNTKTVDFRRRWIGYEQQAAKDPNGEIARVLRDHSTYPENLPDLRTNRPPANSKPEGVENCHRARQDRLELADAY